MGKVLPINPFGKCALCGKQISVADGKNQRKEFGFTTAVCETCAQEEENPKGKDDSR